MQICQSRLLAVSVLGERNGDDGRPIRLLTKVEAQFATSGRARRGRHGFGYLLRRPALIPTLGGESWCCPLSSAECVVSLRAEMVSPNPGTSSWGAQDGAARAGISRSRDISGRLCVWHVRLGRSAESVHSIFGDRHSVTRGSAWATSETVGSHLHRLPM